MAVLGQEAVHALIDGGYTDGTGIAQAVASGAEEAPGGRAVERVVGWQVAFGTSPFLRAWFWFFIPQVGAY